MAVEQTSDQGTPRRDGRGRGRLRVLLEAIGLVAPPPQGHEYHGFISYSHAADGQLAPALQKGLQRFAKPWYRAEALRIFRDETDLTATSDLPADIRAALGGSETFILLASPNAAGSRWVRQECDNWLAKGESSADRVLVGLTDGEIVWDESNRGFDWTRTTAIPRHELFAQEPRYVDLRWARNANDLTLARTDFRDAVAALAAPMHHKSMHALVSEEVREQKRTLRIRRLAVGLLAMLTTVAIVLGLIAYTQYNVATSQRNTATSRALAAESGNELGADPQLALLLALRGYDTSPTAQSQSAVRAATEASAVRAYLPGLSGHDTVGGVDAVAFDPTGRYAAVGDSSTVRVWNWTIRAGPGSSRRPYELRASDAVTGVQFAPGGASVLFTEANGSVGAWQWGRDPRVEQVRRGLLDPVLSPDGRHVASVDGDTVVIHALGGGGAPVVVTPPCCLSTQSSEPFAFSENGSYLATLTSRGSVAVFDAASGAQPTTPVRVDGSLPIAVSPDGTRVAVTNGAAVDVYDVAAPTGPPAVHEIVSPPGLPAHCCDVDTPSSLAWDPSGNALAVATGDPWVRVWLGTSVDPIYLNTISDPASTVAFSPDGQSLLSSGGIVPSQVWAWDAATTLGADQATAVTAAAASEGGQLFALASGRGRILLWNLGNHTVAVLASDAVSGNSGSVSQLAFSPDGTRLESAGPDHELRTWDVVDGHYGLLSQQSLPAAATAIDFSADGSQLGVAYPGGVLREASRGGRALGSLPPGSGGAMILSVERSGSMTLLVLPGNGSFAGHLATWNGVTGSPVTESAPVSLPGSPISTAVLLPRDRLAISNSQETQLYQIAGDAVRETRSPLLDADSISLGDGGRTLYGATLSGDVFGWDLNQADAPATVASGVTAAPSVLATADGSRVLVYSIGNSPAQLIPSAQASGFQQVLNLARSRVVRSLTPSEDKEYLDQ